MAIDRCMQQLAQGFKWGGVGEMYEYHVCAGGMCLVIESGLLVLIILLLG